MLSKLKVVLVFYVKGIYSALIDILTSGSSDHTCVLGENQVKCFGRNDYSELGYGDIDNRGESINQMGNNLPNVELGFTPKLIVVGGSEDQLATINGGYTCAISTEKELKCWGSNSAKKGKPGTSFDPFIPMNMSNIDLGSSFIPKSIAIGLQHICALSEEGNIKCFGDSNDKTVLGLEEFKYDGSQIGDNLPEVNVGTNFTVKKICAGSFHTCVLSELNITKCWGKNDEGELGSESQTYFGGKNTMGDLLPSLNFGSFIPSDIECGAYHTCVLSMQGEVKCWGYNNDEQLGHSNGHIGDSSGEMGNSLAKVNVGNNFVVSGISLGQYHSCALSNQGNVKCWGNNEFGQLGYGDTTTRGRDMGGNINLGSNFIAKQISAGKYHTCALSTKNEVKCWGKNTYGQLGSGNTNNIGDSTNQMGESLIKVDLGDIFYGTPIPTKSPSSDPTQQPSIYESVSPSTPTFIPTLFPTKHPVLRPTSFPSQITSYPSFNPTNIPTSYSIPPTISSSTPTNPTLVPSTPTNMPTQIPSQPTNQPSRLPSQSPNIVTGIPSLSPIIITETPTQSPFITTTTPPLSSDPPALILIFLTIFGGIILILIITVIIMCTKARRRHKFKVNNVFDNNLPSKLDTIDQKTFVMKELEGNNTGNTPRGLEMQERVRSKSISDNNDLIGRTMSLTDKTGEHRAIEMRDNLNSEDDLIEDNNMNVTQGQITKAFDGER